MVTIPGGAGPTVTYIDLALLYSSANHRMVRQANIFKADFQVDGHNGGIQNDEQFVVTVLPTTWPIMKAYEHGLERYRRAVADERAVSKVARWNDFRIFFDTAHRDQDTAGTKVLPLGISCNFNPTSGNADYEYARVFDETGTNEYSYHMLGNSDLSGTERSFGMLDEYDNYDDTSTDEASSAQTNYDLILNDVNDDNELNLKEDGNNPPYNKDSLQVPTKSYHLHATGTLTGGPGYKMPKTGIIDVPFGVVKITSYTTEDRDIIIVFKAGKNGGIDITPCLEA